MTAADIKTLYAKNRFDYELAKQQYEDARRTIGALIAKKKDFHRHDYVSSISEIDDNGVIHYGVSATDSDCTGDGTIHISEIATE